MGRSSAGLLCALLTGACFDPRALPPGAITSDGGDAPGMFYGEFSAQKKLTIRAGRVTTSLPGFTVLVDLVADLDLAAIAEPGGSDLAFFDADGARLPHETELYDASGRLVAWVKLPRLDPDADTVFYLAFGAAAGDREDAAETFAAYAGVWHLGEASGAENVRDSTARSDGQVVEAVTLGTDGAVGHGARFDGGGRIAIPDPTDDHLDADPALDLTFSLWGQWDVKRPDDYQVFLYKGATNAGLPGYDFELDDDSAALVTCVANAVDARICVNRDIPAGTWVHLAGVVDRADRELRLFVDGVLAGSMSIGELDLTSSEDLMLGAKPDGNNSLVGMLDEVRVVRAARGGAWLKAEVANRRDPGEFVQVGELELAPTP